MLSAIILFFRRYSIKKQLERLKLSRRLNAQNPYSVDNRELQKQEEKLNRKLRVLDLSLLSTMIIPILTILVSVFVVFGVMRVFTSGIIGYELLFNRDGFFEEEEGKKHWNWDRELDDGDSDLDPELDPGTGPMPTSGGIYPKDKTLKQIAILLELCDKSCDIMSSEVGSKSFLPSTIIALNLRETAGNLFNDPISDTSKDIKGTLIYSNPICNKLREYPYRCSWMRNGTSHFVGGRVSGNRDLGDPKTQVPNQDVTKYNDLGGDHALGYIQTEITSVSSEIKRVYPIGDYENKEYNDATDRWQKDETLGFIRPNIAYIPDEIMNVAYHFGRPMASSGFTGGIRVWNKLNEQSWFNSLSEDEKLFCKDCILEMSYLGGMYMHSRWEGRGQNYVNLMYGTLYLLWGLKADGKLDKLYNVFEFATNNYSAYRRLKSSILRPNHTIGFRDNEDAANIFNDLVRDSRNGVFGSNSRTAVEELRREFSVIGSSMHFNPYRNLYKDIPPLAICFESCGYYIYEQWKAEVDAAEKEEPVIQPGQPGSSQGSLGVWLDYVGSGHFKPLPDNKYYNNGMQCTIYQQTSYITDYAGAINDHESWGANVLPWTNRNRGSTETRTLTKAGCGVYSTAFAITNLLNREVTPMDLLEKRKPNGDKYIESIPLYNYLVVDLAEVYGLEARMVNIPSSNAAFEDLVLSTLKDGGVIVSVFATKPGFKWYERNDPDSRHFMVIRGYNRDDENKLRVYTSATGGKNSRGQSMSFTETGLVELPASEVAESIRGTSGVMEIIKIPGGAASLGPIVEPDTGGNSSDSGGSSSSTGGNTSGGSISGGSSSSVGRFSDLPTNTNSQGVIAGYSYQSSIGNAVFPNIGSAYYNSALGAIYYSQSAKSTTDSMFGINQPSYTNTIRGQQFCGSGSRATYGVQGCSAYAAAMLLSNMIGAQILPNQLPGTNRASSDWPRGSHNPATSGVGFRSFRDSIIPATNQGLANRGINFRIKAVGMNRSELRQRQSHLYEWLDKGAMLFVRVDRTNSTSGNHFVAIVGYDRSDSYNGYYALKVLNSTPGSYSLMDSFHNQIATARHLANGGGLEAYLRNYNDYCCLLVWRTDMATTLPGMSGFQERR